LDDKNFGIKHRGLIFIGMDKLSGRLQAVMVLVAKFIKKNNCEEGIIDFDYDSMMSTSNSYYNQNSFRCGDIGNDSWSATFSFPFDVRSVLEEFVSEKTEPDWDGFTGTKMVIDTKDNTVRLYVELEEYVAGASEDAILKSSSNKDLDEVSKDYIDKNIKSISWDITGGGDSGYIEDYAYDIQYIDDNSENKPTSNELGERSAGLEELAYNLLSRNFGGWENNEGGQGTLIFNPYEGELIVRLALNEIQFDSELVFVGEF